MYAEMTRVPSKKEGISNVVISTNCIRREEEQRKRPATRLLVRKTSTSEEGYRKPPFFSFFFPPLPRLVFAGGKTRSEIQSSHGGFCAFPCCTVWYTRKLAFEDKWKMENGNWRRTEENGNRKWWNDILQVPTTQLANMSIDLKFVELTADVLEIFFMKYIYIYYEIYEIYIYIMPRVYVLSC